MCIFIFIEGLIKGLL